MSRWLLTLFGIALVACLMLWPDGPPPPSSGAANSAVAPVMPNAVREATPATAGGAAPGLEAGGDREAGIPRYELRGRVVDERGQPVADVPVHVAEDPPLSPQAMLQRVQRGQLLGALASAVTDRDGAYVLALAVAVDGPVQVHALPMQLGDAVLRHVRVAGAVTRLADLVAREGRPVRVQVIDAATEQPLAGALVSVRPDGLSLLRLPGREHGRTARTDDAGTAPLPGLPVGSYTFRAEASGYAVREALQQAVQADEDNELRIALPGGASIAGQVFDAAGRAVVDASVAAEPLAATDLGRVAVATDAAGRFVLAGVGEGPHRLRIGKVGYTTLRLEPITAGSEGLVCTLLPQGAVRLTVVDGAGLAVEACSVRARPVGPAAGLRERPVQRFAPADLRDGAFVIEDLEPGPWTLLVETVAAAPVRSEPCEVTAGATAQLRVVVTPGACVRLVARAVDGVPLSGGLATLQANGFDDGPAAEVLAPLQGAVATPNRAVAAASGAIALSHVAPGDYQLRLDVVGRAPHYVRGLVVGAADVDLGVVSLPAASGLSGTARVGGEVDPSVVVQVLVLAGGNLPVGYRIEAAVDAAGAWRCGPKLPAGRYAVMAGRRRADDPFLENQDGASSRVEIELDGDQAEQRVDLQIKG